MEGFVSTVRRMWHELKSAVLDAGSDFADHHDGARRAGGRAGELSMQAGSVTMFSER